MIRNAVTLYEDDARLVVSALDDLLEYIDSDHENRSSLTDDYMEKLIDLKRKIENAVR